MKKIKQSVIFVVLILFCGCALSDNVKAASNKVSIKLNSSKIALAKGKTFQLKATVKGTNHKVKWSCNKKSVATVSSKGKVTAKKSGTAVIIAKVNGMIKKCNVTVVDLYAPSLNEWKKTYDSMETGDNCDVVTYTITWKKVSKATGYQVCYMSKEPDDKSWHTENSTTKKTKFSTSFSGIDIKIKAKVRAYKTVNGKKVYGPWSKVKGKSIPENNSAQSTSTGTTFKKLRGKAFTYKNSKYSYGLAFGKSNSKVYLGIWNPSGTSSSYEDFFFPIKEGQQSYKTKGLRSGYYYNINLKPYSNYVKVTINCNNKKYNYYNISQKFKYTKNAGFADYVNE